MFIHFPTGCHSGLLLTCFFAGISTMEPARVALCWFSALWNMWTWAWHLSHSRYETQRETFHLLWFFRVCCKSTSIYKGGLLYLHSPYTTDCSRKNIPWIRNLYPSPKTNSSPPLKIGQQKPPPKKGKDSEIRHLFRRHLEFFGTKPDKMVRFLGGDIFVRLHRIPLMALAARYLGQDSAFLICPSRWKQRWGERREFAAMDGWMIGRWWQPDIWRRKPPFGCIKTPMGKTYQPQLVRDGFFPSTIWDMRYAGHICHGDSVSVFGTWYWWWWSCCHYVFWTYRKLCSNYSLIIVNMLPKYEYL